ISKRDWSSDVCSSDLDGNDTTAIHNALKEARNNTNQPTLIKVKTIIGYGAPTKSDSNAAHGAPLGEEEAEKAKEYYKWEHEPFYVSNEVYDHFKENIQARGKESEANWKALVEAYKQAYPELGK